ncbi:MAG: hypothetical protein OXU61_02905 [Gammaproteobacteria bacterium]|nr:hypothetical protein [Gammaproteobacteria bacterium]
MRASPATGAGGKRSGAALSAGEPCALRRRLQTLAVAPRALAQAGMRGAWLYRPTVLRNPKKTARGTWG